MPYGDNIDPDLVVSVPDNNDPIDFDGNAVF